MFGRQRADDRTLVERSRAADYQGPTGRATLAQRGQVAFTYVAAAGDDANGRIYTQSTWDTFRDPDQTAGVFAAGPFVVGTGSDLVQAFAVDASGRLYNAVQLSSNTGFLPWRNTGVVVGTDVFLRPNYGTPLITYRNAAGEVEFRTFDNDRISAPKVAPASPRRACRSSSSAGTAPCR
ncbi:hypothetical protein JOD54_002016 [Actinokineospora baliensis]|uniref:hypothetical protein n=1 Tax=Actinokineospora baliensis TaxID=547056 RepID=UPI001958FEBD|nr:hypothetical protein [Actinokineospora baliensis]MBM7771812.1 hypothetical protein [Actinokineospora baliensis]